LSCSEQQCDRCDGELVALADGGCGSREAALDSLEELLGANGETRDKSALLVGQESASLSADAAHYDVIITLRRAFALELAESPEAVMPLRVAVSQAFEVPVGHVAVLSRVLHGRRLEDAAGGKSLDPDLEPPEAAVTIAVAVIMPPNAPPWSDIERAEVEVKIAYHLEVEAESHGFSWGEVPPENVVVLHRPKEVEVKEEDPRSAWSIVIGAALLGALASLAVAGCWFATKAKSHGGALPKWTGKDILGGGTMSSARWPPSLVPSFYKDDRPAADLRSSYPTRINVAAPPKNTSFDGVGAVPTVQGPSGALWRPAARLDPRDGAPDRRLPNKPTPVQLPERQDHPGLPTMTHTATFGANPTPGHPPRPPSEPRIVNGRPRGIHTAQGGKQGAPMMQNSPRSAFVGVSTR
jgi:hypothetical protein